MKEERMMILSMLEEGKITSEEAIELLEALDEAESSSQSNTMEREENYFDEIENIKEEIKNSAEEIKNTAKTHAKKVEGLGSNLGNLISNIVNNIVDKNTSFSLNGLYETVNTKIEKDISNVENPIIDFESINGSINAKSWDEDKISMDITIKYRDKEFTTVDDFYNFYEEGNIFRFEPAYKNNLMISLDVNLPNKYYKEIYLKTTNGKIKVNDFKLGNLIVKTSNGAISVENINSDKIDASTQNGKILLNDISAPIINGETSNGSVSVKDINSENLSIATINGRINFTDVKSNNISGRTLNSSIEVKDVITKKVKLKTTNGAIVCKDIDEKTISELDLSTSNSSIDITLENMEKAKYFDLQTSLGSIALGIPDLVYKVNKQTNIGPKKIIAHSADFDEEKEYVLIKASTSNGSIKVR